MDQKHTKTRWAITLLLLLLVLVHLGFAVYYWLYGGLTLEWGVEIRIHQWTKPWLTAMGLWLVLTGVRPGPFLSRRLGRRVLDPWPGGRPDRSYLRAWALLGAMVGSAVGFHLAESYHYLIPHLGLSLPLVLVLALAGAAVHAAYARLVEVFARRLAWDRSERYAAGLRSGWYVLIWLGLTAGPLTRWEGRFYDPLWPLAAGAFAALAAAWIVARAGARRRGVVTAAALIGLAAMTVCTFRYHRVLTGPGPRDRVIFITLDTTRPDHLSAYGYGRNTSPRIDETASRGVRFERAVAPMGATNPSHVSMFTGFYPRTHGSIKNDLPAAGGLPCVAEFFAARGFATAAIVSRTLLDPGRDLNLTGFQYSSSPGRTGLEATAPAAFRRAADWLTRHRADNAFMWVHFFDPHHEYQPHPDLPHRFSREKNPCKAEARLEGGQKYSPEEVRRCVDLYDEEIAFADQWVGRLLDWIDRLEPKSERPPLIVLVGDHGEALGEYQDRPVPIGFGHPPFLYDHIIRIPLIISWPGLVPEGETRGGVVETVDLAPTLVELIFGRDDYPGQGHSQAGFIRTGDGNDGEGFVQKFRSQKKVPPYPDLARPQYAVYGPRYKLLIDPGGPLELFDLEPDPMERTDLASGSPLASALHAAWSQWMERTPETTPTRVRASQTTRHLLRALGYTQD